MQKLHDEWVDGETKAIQKVSLIKAHLSVGKATSFFTWMRQSNRGTFRKLKLFLKPLRCISFWEQTSERACRGGEDEGEGSFDAVVLTALHKDSAFEDNLVSNSLDLTSSYLYSTMAISKWCSIKEWRIKG